MPKLAVSTTSETAPATRVRSFRDLGMNILIADDYAAIRKHLREILTETFPGARIAEVANVAGVLAQLGNAPIDLLLLDINMPGRTGLDALGEIKALHPGTRVIVVSVHPEEQYAARSLRAGADAYVNKDDASEELAMTAEAVMSAVRDVNSEAYRA